MLYNKLFLYINENPGSERKDIVEYAQKELEVEERKVNKCLNDLFFSGYINEKNGYFSVEFNERGKKKIRK